MNAPLNWSKIATAGAFTTNQVGRLVDAEPRSVASWTEGGRPIICPDYEPIGGRLALSFDALIEARTVSYLLKEGVKRSKLRELMAHLRSKFNDTHPLAREREIVTDGARVFDASAGRLVNLLNDCYASPELMKPALKGRVVHKAGRAAWLEPYPIEMPLVRIDPRRAFGRPVVVEGDVAVPTETLVEALEGDDVGELADWYGLSEEAARQAIAFEKTLNA